MVLVSEAKCHQAVKIQDIIIRDMMAMVMRMQKATGIMKLADMLHWHCLDLAAWCCLGVWRREHIRSAALNIECLDTQFHYFVRKVSLRFCSLRRPVLGLWETAVNLNVEQTDYHPRTFLTST